MDIPLNVVGSGNSAQINAMVGADIINKKLMEMGLNKGTLIKMMKNDSGPLIIRIGETRLVLGRGMAQKVMVQEL